MRGNYHRWAVPFLILAVMLGAGLFNSCREDLSQDLEPGEKWEARMLRDGDQNVGIHDALYVYLEEPIDVDSANWSTVQVYTANPSAVPGAVEFFSYEGPKVEPFGIVFRPMCDLFPDTDYQMFIIGVRRSDGTYIPDMTINFRTGGVPVGLDPFYCDDIALAWDLEDTGGINSGIIDVLSLKDVAATGVHLIPPPPTYQMMNDADYIFGVNSCCLPSYDEYMNSLRSPPYQLLIYILNKENATPLDLGAIAQANRYVNVRPYIPQELIDSMDGDHNWTSNDPVNTTVTFDTGPDRLERKGCLRLGLSGTNSEGDNVSRTLPAGQYFPVDQYTGIHLAAKTGNVIAGLNTTLNLFLFDTENDYIRLQKNLTAADIVWLFVARRISDLTVSGPFDANHVNRISIEIQNNEIVGDLFVDFLSLGDLEDLKVYLPSDVIPSRLTSPLPTLPLYVGADGSSYYARETAGGDHTVDLIDDECSKACPLMSPREAVTEDHLAQQAP